MPLPNSGVGATLTGGPNTPEANAGKASPQTLFGMAPGWPPAHATGQADRAQEEKPGLQQTLFGVAPAAQRALASEATNPDGQAPAGSAHGVQASLHSDAGLSQRTLLGVMPEALAKAIDAARGKSPPLAPNPPSTRSADPPKAGQAALRAAGGSAPFEPVRNAATLIGAPVPAPLPHQFADAGSPADQRAHPWVEAEAPVMGQVEDDSLALAETGEAGAAADLPGRELTASPHPGKLAHARTQLGVAIPGVAPLRAGVSGSPPQPASPPERPPPATTIEPQSVSGAFAIPPRPQMPRSALVLLCSGVVLALSAVAFAVLWKGAKPLSALVSADATGRDRIDIVCEACPDGTILDVDGVSAEVKERKAYVTLGRALALGDNELTFGIKRPGTEDRQLVELSLPPVEYRIRPDTSTLTGDEPRLTLKIDALPGSQVQIAERPVALDAEGRSEVAVDITGHLTGTASEVSTFEQAIRYAITPPSGKRYDGELSVKIGVTPLLLEAPGSDTVTDLERFMLAGRTTKGAELSVAGNIIPVDETGRFAQLMSIDSVGETKVSVRASQPGLAPRFAVFRLERVKNLRAEAAVRQKSALTLAEVARNIPSYLGKTVFVTGEVEEVRVDGHRTLIIVQADGECAGRSCLARLVYGGLRKLARGAKLTAIGQLQGAVGAAGNQNVPEIEVSLLL